MDPRRVSRLVEQTAVGEGERDEVSKGVTVGGGPPGSREAEGEGGGGFYIERKFDLLVISREGRKPRPWRRFT
jgi:hypothetical protein